MLKERERIKFVCIIKNKMLNKLKYLSAVFFTIVFFIFSFAILDEDISKYILILFMLPALLFLTYKKRSTFVIWLFSMTAILLAFANFGFSSLFTIIFISFTVTSFILYFLFKPQNVNNPALQKKNSELKYFKEELLNEENYLKNEKDTLEKNLEKIINFYMVSKDLIQNFTDSQNAATALLGILEKQKGVKYVVFTSKDKNSNDTKGMQISSKLDSELKEKWKAKLKNNIEVQNLKQSCVVNSLHSIEDKPVIAWPVIINNELVACTFLVVEKEYIQEFIEQGKLYIPHLQLGTERILLFLEMKNKSRTDALTGAYLRRYFLEKLSIEIKRAKRYKTSFHILMLDIDFFKKINDTYGHLTGDKVLVKISKTIEQNIRPLDILCRYGGEEFIVLINNLNDNAVTNIAQKIRNEIKQLKFNTVDSSFSVTISIGISKYKNSLSAKAVIATADKALYEAKKSGRDKVVYFKDHQ